MSIYWFIYLLGFGFALFYIADDFIGWCEKNKMDYREGLNDTRMIFNFILMAIGSWATVLFIYMSKEDD